MIVRDLLRLLESMDPDSRVLLAHQPSYPLQEVVSNVVEFTPGEDAECEECGGEARYCDCDTDDGRDEEMPVVYLVAGGHPDDASPYAPRAVFGR